MKESVIPILKENGLPQPLYGFAMTGAGKRIAAHLTVLAMTGR